MTKQSKVIIVTGATSGIGRATAIAAVEKGHQVMLAARHEDQLEQLSNVLNAKHANSAAYQVTDVSKKTDLIRLVEKTLDKFDRIDVLDNNAGIMKFGSLSTTSSNDWDAMIDINIKGVLYGIEAVLPVMHTQGYGQIVTTDSTAGHQVGQNNSVYSATKFAIQAIMTGLRLEESPNHIRSMMVSPAFTDTGFFNEKDSEPFKQVKRLEPKNVAEAVLYAIDQPSNVDINEIILHPTY
ncbi:SDR family oxidoreductase [Pediococcus argentinicus]|uniref:Short-chain alcohol dehydrogenase n=1 Tax=Pediococcus argentinicus TaxID=480391 RepID=A0A0R2NDM9_9LACO|nr:SDR family oxidoreductase [Pediococcus argentinicus]KRO21997.1 short-chain alcohol dehydrogenase [Pediococcus argentinicus]NKZ23094.1 SDR family oxidoreductase [Pediococcus argentinicus]GEP20233.1 oxidoreductase [Pediococcus argentinicus]